MRHGIGYSEWGNKAREKAEEVHLEVMLNRPQGWFTIVTEYNGKPMLEIRVPLSGAIIKFGAYKAKLFLQEFDNIKDAFSKNKEYIILNQYGDIELSVLQCQAIVQFEEEIIDFVNGNK